MSWRHSGSRQRVQVLREPSWTQTVRPQASLQMAQLWVISSLHPEERPERNHPAKLLWNS